MGKDNDDTQFLDHNSYFGAFLEDLSRARALVIIQSAYVKPGRVGLLRSELAKCTSRGVRVCVIAQLPNDWNEEQRLADLKALEAPIQTLQTIGVHVSLRLGAHEKIVVIDEEILYFGSLNTLSFYESTEGMLRFVNRVYVERAMVKYKLDFCAVCSARAPLGLLPSKDTSPSESLQFIGKCIARRRRELGLSQTELARASKIRQSVISDIELGKRNVEFDTFHRIFKVLNLRMLPVPWHFMRTLGETLDYNFDVEKQLNTSPTKTTTCENPDTITCLSLKNAKTPDFLSLWSYSDKTM